MRVAPLVDTLDKHKAESRTSYWPPRASGINIRITSPARLHDAVVASLTGLLNWLSA